MTSEPTRGDRAASSDAQQAAPQPHNSEADHQDQTQGAGTAGAGAPVQNATGEKNPYFDFTGYQVRMPASWPGSVRAALPSVRGGIGSIFQTSHMPMDARIGYWIWLVGCVLTIVGWILSVLTILFGILFSPFILIGTGMMGLFGGFRWGVILFYFASMMLTLLILLVQLGLTLKIRERAEWARAALTALTVLSIVYAMILTAAGLESGGAGTVVVSIISLALVGIFWLPQANAWFLGLPTAEAAGPAQPDES